ncbi:MAG: ATPase domain-containing protein [Thermoplasmata archaeon]
MYYSFKIEGDELDKRMGGGLYVGQLVTISGDNSSGKTLLALRLAYGFLKNGLNVAYISSQLPVREFVSLSDALGYSIFNQMISGTFTFITPVFLLRKSRKASIDELLENEILIKKNIIVIDSLLPSMYSSFEISSFLEKLRKFSENRIVIMTMNPANFDDHTQIKINQLSTTLITLHSMDLGSTKKHFIDLIKYPMAVKSIQQSIPFRVEPGRGLIVEISSVS